MFSSEWFKAKELHAAKEQLVHHGSHQDGASSAEQTFVHKLQQETFAFVKEIFLLHYSAVKYSLFTVTYHHMAHSYVAFYQVPRGNMDSVVRNGWIPGRKYESHCLPQRLID